MEIESGEIMFTSERHQLILQKLKDEHKVKVKELSQLFKVSEDCIRKDLKVLEKENQLKRTYGGAIPCEVNKFVFRSVFERRNLDVATKEKIAQIAYDQIETGDTIFLDVSTTNICLANLLAKGEKPCMVVSNMFDILQILAGCPNVGIIGTGGDVSKELNAFVGSMSVEVLSKYYFDKVFVGSTGIDFNDLMTTTFDVNDGVVKAKAVTNAKQSYLVMESIKFDSIGTYKCLPLENVNYIISEQLPTPKKIKALQQIGVQIMGGYHD